MGQAVAAYKNVVESENFEEAVRIRELSSYNEASALAYAERKGKAEGIAEGITQGKAEGRAEEQARMAIALHNNGIAIDIIAKTTGLSTNEINQTINQNEAKQKTV